MAEGKRRGILSLNLIFRREPSKSEPSKEAAAEKKEKNNGAGEAARRKVLANQGCSVFTSHNNAEWPQAGEEDSTPFLFFFFRVVRG